MLSEETWVLTGAAGVAGAHGVLHLGGLADEADFHELADVNIVGTFHVLEAARRAGTRRVVHASSNRVTGFYPTTTVVAPDMPPRPDGLYGVSKVAAEALGRLYADKFGLPVVVSLRLGSFEQGPRDECRLSAAPRSANRSAHERDRHRGLTIHTNPRVHVSVQACVRHSSPRGDTATVGVR